MYYSGIWMQEMSYCHIGFIYLGENTYILYSSVKLYHSS